MNWYNFFAYFYDHSIEKIYFAYRKQIVQELPLKPDLTVVDLACGTGQNFPHLIEKIQDQGQLFGIDFSSKMLERANHKIRKNNWKSIKLIEKDARILQLKDLQEVSNKNIEIDAIICTLGLSVIPNWEDVLRNTFALLKPGGIYIIFDVYAERWVPQTSIVKFMAKADLSRRSWILLEEISENFNMRFLSGSPHIHGGKLFLAKGIKSSE